MPTKVMAIKEKIPNKLRGIGEGLTVKELKKIRDLNCSEDTIRKALNLLIGEGTVSEEVKKRKKDHKSNAVYKLVA
jgi:DNA-binding GntR family transcriptional regulator